MIKQTLIAIPVALIVLGAFAAGCGGTKSSTPAATSSTSAPSATGTTTASGGGTSSGSGALTAEAQSAAAGDIPDNQVFLTFKDTAAGYSMQYPEGWAQRGDGRRVTFQDKNNLVRIVIVPKTVGTVQDVQRDMTALKAATPSLRFQAPTAIPISGRQAFKVVYSTESAPNPVTGKRVTLVVDRYYVPGSAKTAIVDLGTPRGVDNVDAYRQMIESFRWK